MKLKWKDKKYMYWFINKKIFKNKLPLIPNSILWGDDKWWWKVSITRS